MKVITSEVDGSQSEVELTADTIGAETPTGAQGKSDACLVASKEYTDNSYKLIIGGAPAMLDTLYELSNAISNDPNFAANMLKLIEAKASIDSVYTKTVSDSKFAPNGRGVGGTTLLELNNIDLNSPLENGTYWIGAIGTNLPVVGGYGTLRVSMVIPSDGIQEYFHNSGSQWLRMKNTWVWSSWRQPNATAPAISDKV